MSESGSETVPPPREVSEAAVERKNVENNINEISQTILDARERAANALHLTEDQKKNFHFRGLLHEYPGEVHKDLLFPMFQFGRNPRSSKIYVSLGKDFSEVFVVSFNANRIDIDWAKRPEGIQKIETGWNNKAQETESIDPVDVYKRRYYSDKAWFLKHLGSKGILYEDGGSLHIDRPVLVPKTKKLDDKNPNIWRMWIRGMETPNPIAKKDTPEEINEIVSEIFGYKNLKKLNNNRPGFPLPSKLTEEQVVHVIHTATKSAIYSLDLASKSTSKEET